MKNLKKMLAIGLAAAMGVMALSGCSGKNPQSNGSEDTYKIGVLQYADHPSLDNCRTGFIEGLKEAGFIEGENLVIDAQSAKGDDASDTQIAQNFAAEGMDLVCGIATPSAQALYNACFEANIPVVFNAVSDPVAANLAKSETEAMEGISGISDALPVEAQLELIREMLPDAKTIGILYTTSEANSVSTIEKYNSLVADYGFELVAQGISSAADIPQAAEELASKVDCISNMTDNTVVNNLPILLEKASAHNIPVFGSEEEQVGNGCVASAGIDYVALGKQAGAIAARVLKGEDISTIPYQTITESKITINENAAAAISLTIPQSIADRAEVKNAPSEA